MKNKLESGQQTLHKYLINRSQQGDRKAQSELYNLYVHAMYNICRRMMGNDEEAKDILQESFIQAFSKLPTLKDEALFPAWLKRLVINRCLNALKRHDNAMMTVAELEEIPLEEDCPDETSFKLELVKKALDRISAGCRTVLTLYVFEGYDHQEIAEILSISESASKAQYSKAKKKIRQIVKEELY